MNRKLYRSQINFKVWNTPAKKLRAGTPPRPSSPCKIQLNNIKEQRTDFICGPCREQLDGLTCIGNVNAYLSSERRRHGRSEVIVTYRMQMRRTDSARRDHGLRPTRALQYGLNWLRPFQTTWNRGNIDGGVRTLKKFRPPPGRTSGKRSAQCFAWKYPSLIRNDDGLWIRAAVGQFSSKKPAITFNSLMFLFDYYAPAP